ncbi:MAG: hypothetical protein NXY57DRAFT_957154 [Lentinula lateritia]|uniref:Uncharacterized protein n=1 Tax=Lentinula lateritia TaxID=40482 RepID=A0ABQ8VZT6_9AGAR|nr:MAG: hypothetical protein NXY57DRAFT_957154 [Lentinula lateritia]KAJ4501830.1 hypothetical protein C8R41DRAFT_913111 [Lentinula lateritia]
MILDDKALLNPPPPYSYDILSHSNLSSIDRDGETASSVGDNNPYHSARKSKPMFSSLPSHLLLQIVYCTFPWKDGQFEGDVKEVLQRRTLYWLETSLRFVNRDLYIACMHILRSTYLPSYDSLIRPPYSSDPFPSSNSVPLYGTSTSLWNSPYGSSRLFPQHRELQTLDLFIAVLAQEELLYDTSSLHLSRHEAYKDIFDLRQPQSRLEDLVAKEGVKAGLVTLGDGDSIPDTPTTHQTPSEAKGKENSPYFMDTDNNSSLLALPRASTSSLSKPLKKAKSSFSLFSAFSSKGKGKGKAMIAVQRLSQPTERKVLLSPLPFRSLSISFSTRKISLMYAPSYCAGSKSSLTVTGTSSSSAYGGTTYGALGLSYNSHGRKRTIVEVQRDRDEALEVSVRRVVRGLREWMEEEAR